MLLDIPLPLKLEDASDDEEVQENLLASFPAVGAVLGLAAYLVAYILALLLPIPAASAVIVAIVLSLGSELAASSSNISLLTSFIRAKISKMNDVEIATSIDSNISLDNPMSLMLFLSLYLFKVFCIGLLVYHGKTSWIIITFTLAYLVRSQIATLPLIGSTVPMIETEEEKSAVKIPWIVASVIVLCTGITYLPASIIILLITLAMIVGFKKYTSMLGGTSAPVIGLCGVISELIYLFAGVAIVIR